ncbi:putative DNA modification/repair radical SAM protein [Ottowia thiooxydans]|uniref:DNA modification/repair radical SAM protein n=1 Tax=Ottowia thiooxydans TaxID=219182 RepID=A0ABV2QD96_9BURK
MEIRQKLSLLADAAKYDASCASSGVKNRDSLGGSGMGSANGTGICHSYTPDGRCVSLLKILLTNFCIYDCQYCINRKSSNVRRARFDVDEVVHLTLDFYRRNLIEGLFLSSGIIQSADYTMEQLVRVARDLRQVHDFRGYIHLKAIPEASAEMLAQAGLFADRLSINIELPSQGSLEKLAPEKSLATIHHSMGEIASKVQESVVERAANQDRVQSLPGGRGVRRAAAPRFAPGGQSTQLIVGADASDDNQILQVSSNLYTSHQLRRVYYSAFSPIPESPSMLPLGQPPMMREHRLYQADWLLRNYGFAVSEIRESLRNGMLDLELDPKLAWALQQRQRFPVNLNTASREDILRVPGLGAKSVDVLLRARRTRSLRLGDLAKLRIRLDKVRPFVEVADHHPHTTLDDPQLRSRLLMAQTASRATLKHAGLQVESAAQASLF